MFQNGKGLCQHFMPFVAVGVFLGCWKMSQLSGECDSHKLGRLDGRRSAIIHLL